MEELKTMESLEVITSAGIIRAYKTVDPGEPGICILFQPAGSDCEIDMCDVVVCENTDYQTKDKERPIDIIQRLWEDVYTEDYTRKNIIRREDVVEALEI